VADGQVVAAVLVKSDDELLQVGALNVLKSEADLENAVSLQVAVYLVKMWPLLGVAEVGDQQSRKRERPRLCYRSFAGPP
jgi:hypothetical protein